MIRGTTAPFIFSIPQDFGTITHIVVIFWQNGYAGTVTAPLPIVKYYDNTASEIQNDGFNITTDNVTISLTPDETLRFSDEAKGYVQMTIYNQFEDKKYTNRYKTFMVYPVKSNTPFDVPIIPPAEDGIYYLDAGGI